MSAACRNLVKRVINKEKITLPQWQFLVNEGYATKETELQFTPSGRIESGYMLTEEGRKLAESE